MAEAALVPRDSPLWGAGGLQVHRAGAEGQKEKSCTTKGICPFSVGPAELRQPLQAARGLEP